MASSAAVPAPATQPAVPVAEPPPAPTLEEAQALTPDSDFRRFAGAGVDPQVKNAAMKKLFADPHFNVMDGLDTYIDDYSRPDPIPPEMLRQLASAKFLKLFEEEEKEEEEKEAMRKASATLSIRTEAETQAHPQVMVAIDGQMKQTKKSRKFKENLNMFERWLRFKMFVLLKSCKDGISGGSAPANKRKFFLFNLF